MELNEQYQSNIDFIKNYDPQKGVSVNSGKLVASGNNARVTGISDEVLKSIDESLNYNRDLSNKIISLLARSENSSPGKTHDKVQNLLQLIDHSKQIKNGLDNLVSTSEQSGHSTEEVERLKAIVSVHIEQLSKLLDKEPTLLKISSNRTDAPLDVALKTLKKVDQKAAFRQAIEDDNQEGILFFLSRGADINMRFADGDTPLTRALSFDDQAMALLLIKSGADVSIPDDEGLTPLMLAAFGGHTKCAKRILKKGIKPDEATADGGNTALHAAAQSGNIKIVNELLWAGADPLKKNDSGWTPIDFAAEGEHVLVCKQMFQAIKFEKLTDDERKDIFIYSALNGLISQVKDLIKLSPEFVNLNLGNGQTPLMLAISRDQKPMISFLLDNGAKVSGVYDNYGHDPLIKAAFNGSRDLIKDLTARGADFSYRDPNGLTALEYFLTYHNDKIFGISKIIPSSAFDESFEHFGMKGLQKSSDNIEELVIKLDTVQVNILNKRFDLPIEDSTRRSADQLYAQLQQSRFDVEQLRHDNVQAHSRMQTARMSGSTTIKASSGSSQPSLASQNWMQADELVRSFALNREPLTSQKISQLNSILNPLNVDVKYRNVRVTAGGNTMRTYVLQSKVRREMDKFTPWLEGKLVECDAGKENPIIVAAQAYQRLVSIHPYTDGNGRTCRFVMDYVLQRYGLPPSSMGDVNVAMFGGFLDDITPSTAVEKVMRGLENSAKYFQT